jgi:transketolase
VGSHCGVSLAADGPSQMAVSDVGYVRTLAHVSNGRSDATCHLFHPSDAVSAYRLCELMANTEGLCYLRTHRPDAAFLYPLDETFALGGCKQLRKGGDLTLVGSGYMVHSVLAAAEQLASRKITCHVFDAYTLPMDASPILQAARKAGGLVLCVEDNYVGGVGSELAEAAAAEGEVRVLAMTPQRIPKSAKTAEDVFAYVGIGVEQIVARALSLIRG